MHARRLLPGRAREDGELSDSDIPDPETDTAIPPVVPIVPDTATELPDPRIASVPLREGRQLGVTRRSGRRRRSPDRFSPDQYS